LIDCLHRALLVAILTQTGGEGRASQIPLAAFVPNSFTDTNDMQPQPPANNFGNNDNFTVDQISIFLDGRVTNDPGGFVPTTWSGTNHAFLLDDTRPAPDHAAQSGGSELRIGLSLNNAPGGNCRALASHRR
jgi:hypothetical protein